MRRIYSASCLIVVSVWLQTSAVHAYRNPERFGADVMEGGGGGKFFTGSRAEGYTCDVCHTTGETPNWSIGGLPVEGYLPGQTYHITIDWPDELQSIALNLELTDVNGARFGELSIPQPTTFAADDLCTIGDQRGAPGLTIVDAPLNRRVVLMSECAQRQTSVDWQAPLIVPGQVSPQGWFTASMLISDRNGKVTGDSVVNVSRVLKAFGATDPEASRLVGGCSVTATGIACDARLGLASVLGLLALRLHRRRMRRASHSLVVSR